MVLDKYTIIEALRVRTIYNRLQYFSPGDLEAEFNESGFAVKDYFSDVAGAPFAPESKEYAVVAKKL